MKAFNSVSYDVLYARENLEKWTEWIEMVPAIKVPRGCTIAVIPPFAGAASRFIIRHKNGARVSVYLDSCSRLGAVDTIYWEVYPVDGDCARCDMEDVTSLEKYIRQSLKEQANGKKQ